MLIKKQKKDFYSVIPILVIFALIIIFNTIWNTDITSVTIDSEVVVLALVCDENFYIEAFVLFIIKYQIALQVYKLHLFGEKTDKFSWWIWVEIRMEVEVNK